MKSNKYIKEIKETIKKIYRKNPSKILILA